MLVTCFSTPRSVKKILRRDRGVRQPLGHQLEHLPLASGQLVEWIVAPSPADQLRDHAGIERGAAPGDPLDRRDEVGQVVDPVLEQVADPFRALLQELERVALLDVLGENEHGGLRVLVADLLRRA